MLKFTLDTLENKAELDIHRIFSSEREVMRSKYEFILIEDFPFKNEVYLKKSLCYLTLF